MCWWGQWVVEGALGRAAVACLACSMPYPQGAFCFAYIARILLVLCCCASLLMLLGGKGRELGFGWQGG